MLTRRFFHHIFTPLRNFIKDSRAIGIMLILCTVLSLVLANLHATQTGYTSFWQQRAIIGGTLFHFPGTTLEWINDMLMTFFFFLVGMEIKRELTIGKLASIKKSLLPIFAAIGGMVI